MNLIANQTKIAYGSAFYKRSVESCLQDNNIEIYSIHIEGKSVVAKKFIRTLKNKIYRYMTSISQNVYIDKLDNIINKYSNTYRTTKMKPVIFAFIKKNIKI